MENLEGTDIKFINSQVEHSLPSDVCYNNDLNLKTFEKSCSSVDLIHTMHEAELGNNQFDSDACVKSSKRNNAIRKKTMKRVKRDSNKRSLIIHANCGDSYQVNEDNILNIPECKPLHLHLARENDHDIDHTVQHNCIEVTCDTLKGTECAENTVFTNTLSQDATENADALQRHCLNKSCVCQSDSDSVGSHYLASFSQSNDYLGFLQSVDVRNRTNPGSSSPMTNLAHQPYVSAQNLLLHEQSQCFSNGFTQPMRLVCMPAIVSTGNQQCLMPNVAWTNQASSSQRSPIAMVEKMISNLEHAQRAMAETVTSAFADNSSRAIKRRRKNTESENLLTEPDLLSADEDLSRTFLKSGHEMGEQITSTPLASCAPNLQKDFSLLISPETSCSVLDNQEISKLPDTNDSGTGSTASVSVDEANTDNRLFSVDENEQPSICMSDLNVNHEASDMKDEDIRISNSDDECEEVSVLLPPDDDSIDSPSCPHNHSEYVKLECENPLTEESHQHFSLSVRKGVSIRKRSRSRKVRKTPSRVREYDVVEEKHCDQPVSPFPMCSSSSVMCSPSVAVLASYGAIMPPMIASPWIGGFVPAASALFPSVQPHVACIAYDNTAIPVDCATSPMMGYGNCVGHFMHEKRYCEAEQTSKEMNAPAKDFACANDVSTQTDFNDECDDENEEFNDEADGSCDSLAEIPEEMSAIDVSENIDLAAKDTIDPYEFEPDVSNAESNSRSSENNTSYRAKPPYQLPWKKITKRKGTKLVRKCDRLIVSKKITGNCSHREEFALKNECHENREVNLLEADEGLDSDDSGLGTSESNLKEHDELTSGEGDVSCSIKKVIGSRKLSEINDADFLCGSKLTGTLQERIYLFNILPRLNH